MQRKIKIIAAIVITLIMAGLILGTLLPIFSVDDALLAIGNYYNVSDSWTIKYEDGSEEENVSFPYEVSADKASSIVLLHSVISDYEGLALNFYAENAAFRLFIDGRPVYDAGVSGFRGINTDARIQGGDENAGRNETTGSEAGEVLEQASGSDYDLSSEQSSDQTADEEMEKQEAGEIAADLPSSINDGIMTIELTQVDESQGIYIHEVYIAKRDAKMIGVLRESMYPIVCCILILLMCVVMVTLDVMRAVSGSRLRGLYIVAFMGIDAIAFILLQTDLLKMFFSNKYFFQKMMAVSVIMMPVLMTLFYYKGFNIHFPRLSSSLLVGISSITIVVLLSEFLKYTYANTVSSVLMLVMYVITLVLIIVMLLKWRAVSTGYNTIGFDISGIGCFSLALILTLNGNISRHSNLLEYIIDTLVLMSFLFVTVQHIHIVLTEYKESVEENSKVLENQVKLADEARADAIAANEAKGVFLANMSHEIRTPINAVLGMDEMILRESSEKQIRDYAMDIHTAGQSLLSIINDILDLSKIESGKMEIVPVDYDISSVIHDLTNMIMLRAKNKDLAFEVSVDRELPSRFFGDDVRIKQVMTNILTNAVKYTETGTVWMRVTGKRDGDDEILHFEVEDTGIGIKKEDMGKLFEAFQRIEEGRNRNIEGTGLGMNITMQMLDLMGSKLCVESEYGKGSKFYFDLRQKVMSEVPVGDFEERIKKLGEDYTYSRAFIAPDANILVVDDNSMNRKVFSSLLKPTKINVTEADGGRKAVELAASRHFDIIFMDHMMPEMDGVEALHRIRSLADYPCKDTPIYVLTANAVAGAKEEYLKEGFNGFLSKPIVSAKLEEAIRGCLPEELILPAPEDDVADDSKGAAFLDDLPMVDGLDWQVAFLHLPGEELLKSAISEFYSIIRLHGEKLQNMKENLPDALDDYRIQVHGMKSAAASIGIIPLAGMAKILEFAAKDNDMSRINALHDVFISEWMSYQDKLKGVMGIGLSDEKEKEEIDTDALLALLSMIRQSMEDMDVDTADDSVKKLSGLKLPEELENDARELAAMVADLDSDGASEIIDRMELVIKK